LILSFWNDSIFYLFLGAFPHLVGWVEPEGEWERGRVREGETGEWQKGRVGETGEFLQENLKSKISI
jgi:hypothetical protein